MPSHAGAKATPGRQPDRMTSDSQRRAARLIADLTAAGATVGTAESVTGGALVALLTGVPGASAVVRGAVVAYASEVKAGLLGVDDALLADQGPVSQDVAAQMARGAREALAATFGVATTGEAGPDSASGHPVGTIHLAVSGPWQTLTRTLPRVRGDRDQIRTAAVAGALELLEQAWTSSGTAAAAAAAAGGVVPGKASSESGAVPGNNKP